MAFQGIFTVSLCSKYSRVERQAICPRNPVICCSHHNTEQNIRPTTRRNILGFLLKTAAAALVNVCLSDVASAESLREMTVRSQVESLMESRRRAIDLMSHLRQSQATGEQNRLSADDSEYVARATPVWLTPAIATVTAIASSAVDVGPGLEVEARALGIHLGELDDERRQFSQTGCIRELEEYVETLDRLLARDGLARFVHGRHWNGTAWVEM